MSPKWGLGDTFDTPWALRGSWWELRGAPGPLRRALGELLGISGGSLGTLRGDFGSILGVFLMASGAFFGSQARPIMKRCFLGSQTSFCCFFIPCRKCGDRSHSKKPNVFATFSCHSRGVSFSVFVAIFICFLNYLEVFSCFLACFSIFFDLFGEVSFSRPLFHSFGAHEAQK